MVALSKEFIYKISTQIFTAVAKIKTAKMTWSTFVFIFCPAFAPKRRGNQTGNHHNEGRDIIDLTSGDFAKCRANGRNKGDSQ